MVLCSRASAMARMRAVLHFTVRREFGCRRRALRGARTESRARFDSGGSIHRSITGQPASTCEGNHNAPRGAYGLHHISPLPSGIGTLDTSLNASMRIRFACGPQRDGPPQKIPAIEGGRRIKSRLPGAGAR